MVLIYMSRVAGRSKNRRAISSSLHRSPQHAASPFLSSGYKCAYTHESHLTILFSWASGQFLAYRGGRGYVSPTPSPSSPFDPTPSPPLYSPILSVEAPCT